MTENRRKRIIEEAHKSYQELKNKYNYISLKSATTIVELDNCRDSSGKPVYVKNNLEKGIVYFGEPSTFNDKHEFELKFKEENWLEYILPNDYMVNDYKRYGWNLDEYICKCCSASQRKLVEENRKRLRREGKLISNRRKKELGVFCLAPTYLDKYYWEKYCNNYNGICCEYDINSIKNKAPRAIHLQVKYSNAGVEYLPEYLNPGIDPIGKSNIKSKLMRDRIGKKLDQTTNVINAMLSTKSKKWEREKENRLVLKLNDSSGVVVFSREVHATPVKIYCGYMVSEEIKEYLKTFCKNKQIAFEVVNKTDCITMGNLR